MNKKRPYSPLTTVQQRYLLFETWEESGNVSQACAKAGVCRQTFYTWKPRFEELGYEGLDEAGSHARKNQNRIAEPIEEQVISLRSEHPTWGKRRIANELAKRNSWVALVSPNTVKRILQDAGLWSPAERPEKKKS
jgi:transposase